MAYEKTDWVDHVVDSDTGEIIQQGTRFTARRMNNIESGIGDAHSEVVKLKEYLNYMPIDGGDFDGNDPQNVALDGGLF